MLWLCFLECALAFTSTWQTTTNNAGINWPILHAFSSFLIDWGDGSTDSAVAGSSLTFAHNYVNAGLHVVNVTGNFQWINKDPTTVKPDLMDISDWTGFTMDATLSRTFSYYVNLQVSCPPNTQPTFLPGANLNFMFYRTNFNSSLDWDLTNVTSMSYIFYGSPLSNSTIQFSNTRGVTSLEGLFSLTSFNQPFYFDCFSVTTLIRMFYFADFNSPLTLINTQNVTTLKDMFLYARFNQPLTLNTDSVTDMTQMFKNAYAFNSALNFSSTAKVTTMSTQFYGDGQMTFAQDLSSWNVTNVLNCNPFCDYCGLPNFTQCTPCSNTVMDGTMRVCSTRAPTASPTTLSPTTLSPTISPTTLSPTISPTTLSPTISPTTAAPTTAAPTIAPTPAPTIAPTTTAPTTLAPTVAGVSGAYSLSPPLVAAFLLTLLCFG